MELNKTFDHQAAEKKWYSHWLARGYFHSEPDNREPYTVVIPPPNVTGVLHMGHCLNNTIQDILVRRARMQGKNACWVPGTDHASIATEAKVVQMLREKGINKSKLSREEFLNYAWEWKEKYGGIILQQLKKLGCSLDWDRITFTMDPDYYQSVINVFIDLYNKGYIYRGKRMINWDVKAKTALSDEEVIRKETKQKLYYLKYFISNNPSGNGRPDRVDASAGEGSGHDFITIATVRPETIMGDTAVCVHPDDERYKHLHGKFAIVPLINRPIPIITDDYVSMDFGTGALKVTPAHDMNDYQLGQKHNLEVVDIFNEDGTLNKEAQILIGEDRFEARKKIIQLLEKDHYLIKTEDYTSEVGYSERTDVVVEPRLSLQWWLAMKNISKPALQAVMNDDINFHPAKFRNLYRHWMENIRDWCISRQLWWGQRIPAWYDDEGRFVVAVDIVEAQEKFREQFSIGNAQLTQDEDVLDTWFSSWLWPFEVFKGYSNPGNADIKYYYPTNTLVTAPEIIFFWVARMAMAGFEYMKEKPFNDVYFTGIVRDKLGRKMSKSLGNSPDLLELIDKYGADACRFGIMISSPAGNDLLWDESSNEQGRNFINKIWNALKLVRIWQGRQVASSSGQLSKNSFAIEWFENRLNESRLEIESSLKEFKLSEALKTIYSLIWDDFCSWYLEWVKPGFEEPMEEAVYNKTALFFEDLMQLLHPFMPFVTEEIYHLLTEREEGDDLTLKLFPSINSPSVEVLKTGLILKEIITSIRDARNKNQLKPKDVIQLHLEGSGEFKHEPVKSILLKQVNADSLHLVTQPVAQTISLVVQKEKLYIQTEISLNSETQKEQLLKDLSYLKGFLSSVEKKLSNEKFVQNARPEVIELEKRKQVDTEMKISIIEKALAGLPR